MRKGYIKTIAISIMAAYVFTMAFGYMNLKNSSESKEDVGFEMSYINDEPSDKPSDIDYLSSVINRLYNAIVAVGKVVKV